MSKEYFSILGLAPARYSPREITRRFQALRSHLDESDVGDSDAVRRQRDDLYLAYAALCEPVRQAAYLHGLQHGTTPQRELRRMIAASLEDDLLRHARREMILREGRRIGLSEFQTQLMIAEVQFGEVDPTSVPDVALPDPACVRGASHRSTPVRPAARLAAAGALAAVLVVAFQRWLAL